MPIVNAATEAYELIDKLLECYRHREHPKKDLIERCRKLLPAGYINSYYAPVKGHDDGSKNA